MATLDTALQQLITAVTERIGMKLLWSNASPTSGFAAQTISLDLSGYDFVAIQHRWGTTVEDYHFSIVGKSKKTHLKQLENASYANVILTSRGVTVTNTGVTFEAGYSKTIYSSSSGGSQATSLIPVAIYGLKGVI